MIFGILSSVVCVERWNSVVVYGLYPEGYNTIHATRDKGKFYGVKRLPIITQITPRCNRRPYVDNAGNDKAIFFSNYAVEYICYRGCRVSGRSNKEAVAPRELTRYCGRLRSGKIRGVGLMATSRFTRTIIGDLRVCGPEVPVMCGYDKCADPGALDVLSKLISVCLPSFGCTSSFLTMGCSSTPGCIGATITTVRRVAFRINLPRFSSSNVVGGNIVMERLVLPTRAGGDLRILSVMGHEFNSRILLDLVYRCVPVNGIDSERFSQVGHGVAHQRCSGMGLRVVQLKVSNFARRLSSTSRDCIPR